MKKIYPGIIVDGFTIKEENTIYFLTHWHSDHYMGISNKWPYGPIYTSQTTKKILHTKYPKLQDQVIGLQLAKCYTIKNNLNNQNFNVRLFDSNHMAGSVMILLQFENGQNILHTGDMRFNYSVLYRLTDLFQLVPNSSNTYRCKYKIDRLYLDNTYCDPIFQFPNRSDAINIAKRVIDNNIDKITKVYLITYTIGKQQALIALAVHYRTKIVVCEERYAYVMAIFGDKADYFFTTDENCGWIQVIKPQQKELILKFDHCSIVITLTGWANIQDFHQFSQNQYIVPYSLHSNYEELQLFVSVVKPSKILPIVAHNTEKQSTDFRKIIHSYQSYFNSLTYMKQRGLDFLIKTYEGSKNKQNT